MRDDLTIGMGRRAETSGGSGGGAVLVVDIVAAADFATVGDTPRHLRLAMSPSY